MLGPIGSEVMSIFRLLSPHAIDEYIVEDTVARVEGAKTATGEELPHDSSKQFYSKGERQQAPSEPQEAFDVDKPAKIVPLNEYREAKKEELKQEYSQQSSLHQEQEKPRQGSKSALGDIGILSAAQIRAQEEERLRKERANEDSMTVFLLKEREKMRRSKQRITSQVALKTYQSNAAVDLNIQEDEFDEDDEDKNKGNDMRGILVNKKQY